MHCPGLGPIMVCRVSRRPCQRPADVCWPLTFDAEHWNRLHSARSPLAGRMAQVTEASETRSYNGYQLPSLALAWDRAWRECLSVPVVSAA